MSADPLEASIEELQAQLSSATFSVDLVDWYVRRIEAYDQQGPALNAIQHMNDNARALAQALGRDQILASMNAAQVFADSIRKAVAQQLCLVAKHQGSPEVRAGDRCRLGSDINSHHATVPEAGRPHRIRPLQPTRGEAYTFPCFTNYCIFTKW